MAPGEIRDPRLIVTVLPPREGFSPGAVGAVGLIVHRLGAPGDVVIGQGAATPFANRRFLTPLRPLWPPFGQVARYNAGVVRRIRALGAHVIEVHNRANLAADIARAMPRSRVVLFVHNDPQTMRRARSAQARADLLARMHVICVSEYLSHRFMEGLDPTGPTPLVLLNSIDLADLPPRLPPTRREPTLLFVGRIVADKGADAFVAACAEILPQLPGWRAEMIGADRFTASSPETPFLRALRQSAAAAGIAMHGYQPHAEVLQAMARAAIVAVPSRWAEPFGLTALEAAASGATLVCGPRGGLPEVAGDAALYADPDTPGALADALKALATDEPARARLAEAGLARARMFDAQLARARLARLRQGWQEEALGSAQTRRGAPGGTN